MSVDDDIMAARLAQVELVTKLTEAKAERDAALQAQLENGYRVLALEKERDAALAQNKVLTEQLAAMNDALLEQKFGKPGTDVASNMTRLAGELAAALARAEAQTYTMVGKQDGDTFTPIVKDLSTGELSYGKPRKEAK